MYKVAVTPAMTYGAETGAITKAQENKLNTTEMRKLRWACGQTLLDHVENREMRGRAKVTELHRKIQEKKLRWYEHILRRDEEHVISRATNMKVEGRRKHGRPRRKWMDCVREDLEEKQLSTEDAADRLRWKRVAANGDPA